MLNQKKSAFTLIELLVVIAIIGILATISVIALQNARAKSRDAKRVGNMKQIQTALELFFNDQGRYPSAEEWATGQLYSTSTNSTSTYMQIIPQAPTPTDGGCTINQNAINYIPTVDGYSYSISFCLGNNTGTLNPGPKCLTPAGIIDRDCFLCGEQVNVSSVAGHTCNTGAPDYDTCIYDTVNIGGQCWMKQNINIGQSVVGTTTQSDNTILEKYCYNDVSGNCLTDGGLYRWDEAMQYSVSELNRGICPSGWHIPSDAEQNTLDQNLNDGTCLANRDGTWDCANASTKLQLGGSSGFDAIFAGFRDVNEFGYRLAHTFFWSSTINGSDAWYRYLYIGYPTVSRDHVSRAYNLSVRCLRD